jgi:hypothetical protein
VGVGDTSGLGWLGRRDGVSYQGWTTIPCVRQGWMTKKSVAVEKWNSSAIRRVYCLSLLDVDLA